MVFVSCFAALNISCIFGVSFLPFFFFSRVSGGFVSVLFVYNYSVCVFVFCLYARSVCVCVCNY